MAGKSWCGEDLHYFDWAYQNIDHAAYSIINGSRQVPCSRCLKAIAKVLEGSSE
jgi:hypothetical protein